MKRLLVEIADTPSRVAKGLMFRENLDEDSGMLFKFQYSDYLRFWMKSTYIPLDIAFLDDDGTIFQIAEMYPKSTRIIVAKQPCRYALEVNRGWFDKNNISVGDIVGGLEIADKSYRKAQSTIGNPSFPVNRNVLQNKPKFNVPSIPANQAVNPNPQGQGVPDPQGQGDQQGQEQQTNVSPKVEVTLDDRSKVQFAEQHNRPMQIVYQSKQSGVTLPPRKLLPVSGEGYPIRSGEGGEYFVAFDASPTINGGEWQILGNQIKRFLFQNIIALEVLEEFAQDTRKK